MTSIVFYICVVYYYYCYNFCPDFDRLGLEFVTAIFLGLIANLKHNNREK